MTLTFPEEIIFDCWALEEVIELGHRVRRFALDVRENGSWRTMAQGQCIGFCRCQRTAQVRTDGVRLRILDAGAPPVLRRIRLYDTRGIDLTGSQARSSGDLTVNISREGGAILADLGGIYPFDTVHFRSAGPVTIHAFNGTRYEPIWTGTDSPARFPAVTGSYRLMLTGDVEPDSVRVSLT